jgi:hypothetical protein
MMELIKINDKITKRSYVDAHLLDNYLMSVINAPDKKTGNKAAQDYKNLIKGYTHGK